MPTSIPLRSLLSALVLSASGPVLEGETSRVAPHPDAPLVDQLLISGNACGPAALLNAFRTGSPDWQRPAAALPGTSERERLGYLIRRYGIRPSGELKGRNRWSRAGVNLADLRDMANEMSYPYLLPQLRQEVFMINPGDNPHKLLCLVHHRLETSLRNGFPPIISLRQMSFREPADSGTPGWTTVRGHFVTIIRVPMTVANNADALPVSYIDPWGAKRAEGIIRLPGPNHPVFSFEASFPTVTHALNPPSGGKPPFAALTFAAILGRY